jgi:exopolysaccharide biosynthesis polyprenyl glycosylphosphotransferase
MPNRAVNRMRTTSVYNAYSDPVLEEQTMESPGLDSASRQRNDSSFAASWSTPFLGGLQRRGGSITARPYLFTSTAAWAVLDFCLAFYYATLIDLSKNGPGVTGAHSHLASILSGMLYGLCVTALSRLSGLHSVAERRNWFTELLLIMQVVALAGFGLYGASRFWRVTALTRGVLLQDFLLIGAAMFFCRALCRRHRYLLCQRDIATRNVLIVGADSIGREVRDHLASLRFAGYRFKGFVALGEPSDDMEETVDGEVIGDISSVIPLASSMFVDEIIFTRRPSTPNVLAGVIHQARSTGIDIRLVPSLAETLNNRADVQYVGNLPTIVIYQKKHPALSLLAKRTIDIVAASIAIVALLPLFLLIALAIRLQSSGPVFYLSNRVGYKGNVFTCFKFRTMVINAEAMKEKLAHLNERQGILFKISKDPRVTGVGAILRKYSLDELPQLWNVLRGDMSLVGPRPSISSEVAQYKTAHLRRLDVVPGITGLWQVEARQDPSFESYIKFDSKYVNDWSIWLDLKILLRTVSAVISGTGA